MKMETKYSICDKVAYFNTAEREVMTETVKGVRIIPRSISKDKDGNAVLYSFVVLYETTGPVLAEQECFSSVEECKAFYRDFFNKE